MHRRALTASFCSMNVSNRREPAPQTGFPKRIARKPRQRHRSIVADFTIVSASESAGRVRPRRRVQPTGRSVIRRCALLRMPLAATV